MSSLFRSITACFLIIISQQVYFPYNLYQLSPSFPPTAFVGQYYTCTFRIGGLSSPIFVFEGLPQYLIASGEGKIEGIPGAVGSFNFTVSYKQGKIEASQQLVLTVSQSPYQATYQQSRNSSALDWSWMQTDVPTLYQTGKRINIDLNPRSSNHYNWAFLNLPSQLSSSSEGIIRGVFSREGMYSFGATCYDYQGNFVDYFFTLNIQSQNYISLDFRDVPAVPIRNALRYNATLVFKQREEAVLKVKDAEDYLGRMRNLLEKIRKINETTSSERERALDGLNQATSLVQAAIKQKSERLNHLDNQDRKRKAAQQLTLLKNTSYNQAVDRASFIQRAIDSTAKLFARIQLILNELTNRFITAQNESAQAAAQLAKAQRNHESAAVDSNLTFQNVLSSKEKLSAFQDNLTKLQLEVSTAKIDQQAARYQNDLASSKLRETDSADQTSISALNLANSEVTNLQRMKDEAKRKLGEAQFSLTQAMNNLFVAQAAKAQSDKAIQTISAQNAQLPSSAASLFSGCDGGSYPIISGSACITSISEKAISLSSGYVLLFGECSKTSGNFTIGTLISFTGYLRNGFIHSTKLALL